MASQRAQNQQNPAGDNAEDDFDFGGFEAADPEPAVQGMQAEAQASPWAAFALGNAQERPDLLCAQNRFPPYLDPSDISGASADSRSMAVGNSNTDAAPLPSLGADLLGDAQFAEARQCPVGPEQAESRLNGRLPDLGLGINENPLFAQPPVNGLTANLQAAAIPDPLPQQLPRVIDVSAANGVVPQLEPPEAVHVEPNVADAAAVQGNDVQRVEEQGIANEHQQNQQQPHQAEAPPAIAQERDAEDAQERLELTQRLESLVERNRVLEEELDRSRGELATQRTRLEDIEARHTETLREVQRAGHEALSVVVEQYKEQLKVVMLQQQEASQALLLDALKEQVASLQEVLNQQRQRHEEERAEDKEEARSNVEKAMEDTRTELQDRFKVFLQEEQEKWKRDMEKAVQEERSTSEAEIQRIAKEEQTSAKERLDQARAEYSTKLEEERKRQEQALGTVRQEEAEKAREHMSSLVSEERERGKESVREALAAAHADTRSYIDEQRRRDSSIRQRHFASLDLFLESCRQQVSFLMSHDRDGDGATLSLPQASNRRDHSNHQQKHSGDSAGSGDTSKDTHDL